MTGNGRRRRGGRREHSAEDPYPHARVVATSSRGASDHAHPRRPSRPHACSAARPFSRRRGRPPGQPPDRLPRRRRQLTFFGDDYGEPRGNGPHEGNDIGAPFGSPVVAVIDGIVELLPGYGGGGFAIRPRVRRRRPRSCTCTSATNSEPRHGLRRRALEDRATRVRQGQVDRVRRLFGQRVDGRLPICTSSTTPAAAPHVNPYAMLLAANNSRWLLDPWRAEGRGTAQPARRSA